MALSSSVPADMKACKSFLQRAEELDRASDPNAKVVAYHCRQYAMELGIALRDRAADAEAATAFLLGLMDALEHEKKALGDVSREDGEQEEQRRLAEVGRHEEDTAEKIIDNVPLAPRT